MQQDESPSQHTPARRPAGRRNWRRLGTTLLLLGMLGSAYYLLHGPTLRPVTRRMLPQKMALRYSLDDYGYPALQTATTQLSDPFWGKDPALIYDDRCQPVPGARAFFGRTSISTTRTRIAWQHGPLRDPRTYTIEECVVEHGRLSRRPSRLRQGYPILLSDTGMVFNDAAYEEYELPDGARAPLRGPGARYHWQGMAWAGPHALVLRRIGDQVVTPGPHGPVRAPYPPADHNLYIYDTQAKRFVLETPVPAGKPAGRFVQATFFRPTLTSIFKLRRPIDATELPLHAFRHGERFLMVPAFGQAEVFARGKRLAVCGTNDTVWGVGEDGSAWWLKGETLMALQWRRGQPRLVTLPYTVPKDLRFVETSRTAEYFGGTLPPGVVISTPGRVGAAVWGEGALAACTRSESLLPDPLLKALARGATMMGRTQPIPREARRLTLYHHGRRIGVFSVRLRPFPRRTVTYREHLAFTADGKYLSWVIDAGNGLQVYVFPVPRWAHHMR